MVVGRLPSSSCGADPQLFVSESMERKMESHLFLDNDSAEQRPAHTNTNHPNATAVVLLLLLLLLCLIGPCSLCAPRWELYNMPNVWRDGLGRGPTSAWPFVTTGYTLETYNNKNKKHEDNHKTQTTTTAENSNKHQQQKTTTTKTVTTTTTDTSPAVG